MDGSLRYRGRIVVPQLAELREEILMEFHCSHFFCASRWNEDVSLSSLPVLLERNEEKRWGFCSTMSHVSTD